jgi:hypothetical protein
MNTTGATEGLWGDTRAETSCACDGVEPREEARVVADEKDTRIVTGEEVKTGTMVSELAAADEEGREIQTDN